MMNKSISKIILKIKENGYLFIFFGSSLALILAYFSEFFLKLTPCPLCKLERILYIIMQSLSIMGIYFTAGKSLIRILIILIGVAEFLVTFYHVGIEHYFFNESFMCIASASSCALVKFRFMNLSLAEWNLVYILSLIYYFIKLEWKNGIFTWRSEA